MLAKISQNDHKYFLELKIDSYQPHQLDNDHSETIVECVEDERVGRRGVAVPTSLSAACRTTNDASLSFNRHRQNLTFIHPASPAAFDSRPFLFVFFALLGASFCFVLHFDSYEWRIEGLIAFALFPAHCPADHLVV